MSTCTQKSVYDNFSHVNALIMLIDEARYCNHVVLGSSHLFVIIVLVHPETDDATVCDFNMTSALFPNIKISNCLPWKSRLMSLGVNFAMVSLVSKYPILYKSFSAFLR